MVADASATEQLGILTPPEKEAPQFNGADIWGVRPGHPVIFRIPVSGVRPMKFAAKAGSGKSYGKPTAEFRVWADSKVVWTSGPIRLGEKPRDVRVPLAGVKEIVLETRSGGAWTATDSANGDWADARFA